MNSCASTMVPPQELFSGSLKVRSIPMLNSFGNDEVWYKQKISNFPKALKSRFYLSLQMISLEDVLRYKKSP